MGAAATNRGRVPSHAPGPEGPESAEGPDGPSGPGALLFALTGLAAGLPLRTDAGSDPPLTPAAAAELTRAARIHGLEGHLLRLAPRAAEESIRAEWRSLRLRRAAANGLALGQLRELLRACDAVGIPVIPLKGAAALLWLRPADPVRALQDLDLLIGPSDVPAARAALERLGYRKTAAFTSPEAERVGEQRLHLAPYVRPESLPVELHLHLNGEQRTHARTHARTPRGHPGTRREQCTAALWEASLPARSAAGPARRLAWEHFALHTAAHYLKHYRHGCAPLKGIADLLAVLTLPESEFSPARFWAAAREWGAESEVARLLAAVEQVWGVPAPAGGPAARPLSPASLAAGGAAGRAGFLTYLLQRLGECRDLPGLPSRCRYLLGLAWPTAANLRWRYQLPPETPLLPVYARYLASQAARMGLRRPFFW